MKEIMLSATKDFTFRGKFYRYGERWHAQYDSIEKTFFIDEGIKLSLEQLRTGFLFEPISEKDLEALLSGIVRVQTDGYASRFSMRLKEEEGLRDYTIEPAFTFDSKHILSHILLEEVTCRKLIREDFIKSVKIHLSLEGLDGTVSLVFNSIEEVVEEFFDFPYREDEDYYLEISIKNHDNEEIPMDKINRRNFYDWKAIGIVR